MSKFQRRSDQKEWMDDFSSEGELINKTLTEIDLINKWLGGNQVTIEGIDKLFSANDKSKGIAVLNIADLGCGSGEMLKLINAWATRRQIEVSLTGIDANSNVIRFAKENLKSYPNVTLIQQDILSDEFRELKFDIIVATLFFHHFTSEQLIALLKQLGKQVQVGIVINDLHRHWFAYHSIRLITRYCSQSSMVKFDAPLSVLRAFSRKDLIAIMNGAGLKNFSIHWRWAFRWQVIIKA